MGLLTEACVAIDGSKFKAVNNRDKNFTQRQDGPTHGADQGERRALSAASSTPPRQEPSEALKTKTSRLKRRSRS